MKKLFAGTLIVIAMSGCENEDSSQSSRSLTETEQSIIAKFKNAGGDAQIKNSLTDKVYISFQPDPLGDSGDCFVVIKGGHSNWDITYQLIKGKSEAVLSQSQHTKGNSFRLKGDSSDKIITFDNTFGRSAMGVISSSPDFSSLIEVLSTSKSIKIDYGQAMGRNLTDTYNPSGFESGYRIAQEICR